MHACIVQQESVAFEIEVGHIRSYGHTVAHPDLRDSQLHPTPPHHLPFHDADRDRGDRNRGDRNRAYMARWMLDFVLILTLTVLTLAGGCWSRRRKCRQPSAVSEAHTVLGLGLGVGLGLGLGGSHSVLLHPHIHPLFLFLRSTCTCT